MKKGFVFIFFILYLNAQQHNERIVGALVTLKDRATWKKIIKQTDVQEKEIVAVFSMLYYDWVYAQVTLVPRSQNFVGLASFVKDGWYYDNFSIDYKKQVKKLLADGETAEANNGENILNCSLFN